MEMTPPFQPQISEHLRVHILGASGSGTTTLGAALATRWGCPHFDVDHVYWLPTTPPFQAKRPLEDRLRMLDQWLTSSESWVLSGSLCSWGDPFVDRFSLVVFVWLPPELRLERLRSRESTRYGEAIQEGEPLHAPYQAFMDWAQQYDQGDLTIRSRATHENWLAELTCPVVRLEGDLSTEARIEIVEQRLSERHS